MWHSTFTIGPDLRLNFGILNLIAPGELGVQSFVGWTLTREGQAEPVANAGADGPTTLAGLREWIVPLVPTEDVDEAIETAREAFEEVPTAFTGEPIYPLVVQVRIPTGPYAGGVVVAPVWRDEIHAVRVAEDRPSGMTLCDSVLVDDPSKVNLTQLWIDTSYDARCRACLEIVARSGPVERRAS